MKRPAFNVSVPVPDQSIGADGIYTFDLAVNPLSVVLINLSMLNDTGTLANFVSYLDAAKAINSVSIMHRGVSVFRMRGEDAAALGYFRHGIIPTQATHLDTNNDRRSVVVPLLMGRHPWDKSSCLPAVNRGDLTLELDLDIADTGYDGLRLSVSTIELLDAKPKEFERKISINQTLAATGDNDVDLPIGALVRGVLLWGTTGFTGATPAPSWGRLKVLLDNIECGYSAIDWEVAHTLHSLWGRQPPMMDAHRHRVTTDGNAQTELTTVGGPFDVGDLFQNYAFLDFDPTGDDEFAVETSGARRFHLRPNAETADAVRAIAIERLPSSAFDA